MRDAYKALIERFPSLIKPFLPRSVFADERPGKVLFILSFLLPQHTVDYMNWKNYMKEL